MNGRLIHDVVVFEGSAVLELLASEYESLLVCGDACYVLDLNSDGLHVISLLDPKSDYLFLADFKCVDQHSTSSSRHEVKGRVLLNFVVLEGSAVLELLATKVDSLLVCGDAVLVLDLNSDGFDGVGLFNLEGDGLSG